MGSEGSPLLPIDVLREGKAGGIWEKMQVITGN